MMKIFFPVLLLSLVSAIVCLTVPAQVTQLQQLIKNYTAINPNITNGVAHAVCESQPSHLSCGNVVKFGHKAEQHLSPSLLMRPCSFFALTPHCCDQFCKPGNGGSCDSNTGACFCNPSGVPNVCNLIMKTQDTPPASNSNHDQEVLDICKTKCANNPNGCTKPAATTDGVTGTICMCYCDPAGDGPDANTPSPPLIDFVVPVVADPLRP